MIQCNMKQGQFPGADNQYLFAELSSVRLTFNKWNVVGNTLYSVMIHCICLIKSRLGTYGLGSPYT